MKAICQQCTKEREVHKVKFEDDSGIGSMLVCDGCVADSLLSDTERAVKYVRDWIAENPGMDFENDQQDRNLLWLKCRIAAEKFDVRPDVVAEIVSED